MGDGRASRAKDSAPWRVTPRDVDMLRWIGRHGIVTTDQIAQQFFRAPDQTVRTRAPWRRIQKLDDLGLLSRHRKFTDLPWVIRTTKAGAALADDGIEPANIVLSDLVHALALVTFVEKLRPAYRNAELFTERQLRGDRLRAIRAGRHEVGRGRIPDALLMFPEQRAVAIELDITEKSPSLYNKLLRAYGSDSYKKVWWYTINDHAAEKLRFLVRRLRLDDLIEVRVWPR
jgi:Replication-relaxation